MLDPLSKDYHVIAMHQRPLWDQNGHKQLKNWNILVDDLIHFFDQHQMQQVIGLGHSLGAVVSVLAARKRPDLFKQLILIEPVTFGKWIEWIKLFIPLNLRSKIFPIAKTALNRRDNWPQKQVLFDSYRNKKIFSRISDDVLNEWIDSATVSNEKGGIMLRYTKEWEAQIYCTVQYFLDDLARLDIPVSMIKGQHTNAISESALNRWKKQRPRDGFVEFEETTHLVPMEDPRKCAQTVLEMIRNVN